MSEQRSALVADLTAELTKAADSVPGEWDGFSLVAEITALGVRVTGFRYYQQGPGLPMLMGTDVIATVAALRDASPGANGELFDIFVARLDRATGELAGNAFSSDSGARFRVTAAHVASVAELIRPGTELAPAGAAAADAAAPDETVIAPAPDDAPVESADPPQPTEGVAESAQLESEAPAATEPSTESSTEPRTNAAAPEPTAADDIADEAGSAGHRLSGDIVGWRELSGDGWDHYAAVATFSDAGINSLGFRYRGDLAAIPTFIGGEFLTDLAAMRAASPGTDGALAGGALLRLERAAGTAEVRFIHDPAAVAQLTWSGADPAVADRLRTRPRPATVAAAVATRPDAASLSPEALLSRISYDLAASLRAVSGWHRYALGVDVGRSRAASVLYDEAGGSRPFTPALSPLGDLTALRQKTADAEPAWVGVIAQAWAGSDRVDFALLDQAGIDALLGQGPGPAAGLMTPPAEPPAEAPARPTFTVRPMAPQPPPAQPVAATDSPDRTTAFAAVASAITAAADLSVLDWDRFVVVVDATGDHPRGTGIRYFGYGPGQPTNVADLGPINSFRDASRREDGAPWRVCIIRGMRATREIRTEFRYTDDANNYLVPPAQIYSMGDQLRPV
ncbi:MAG: hypothetical protein ACR2KJ_10460 [Jatrophihabitans sp.]